MVDRLQEQSTIEVNGDPEQIESQHHSRDPRELIGTIDEEGVTSIDETITGVTRASAYKYVIEIVEYYTEAGDNSQTVPLEMQIAGLGDGNYHMMLHGFDDQNGETIEDWRDNEDAYVLADFESPTSNRDATVGGEVLLSFPRSRPLLSDRGLGTNRQESNQQPRLLHKAGFINTTPDSAADLTFKAEAENPDNDELILRLNVWEMHRAMF